MNHTHRCILPGLILILILIPLLPAGQGKFHRTSRFGKVVFTTPR